LSRRTPKLYYRNRLLKDVDAVIPRIGASITFYGLAVLRQFEMMGAFPLNESQAIARSRDKLRCLQILSREEVGMPPTAFARHPGSRASRPRPTSTSRRRSSATWSACSTDGPSASGHEARVDRLTSLRPRHEASRSHISPALRSREQERRLLIFIRDLFAPLR